MRERYVNVYEVERVYGGPEEGGWDYDVGTPLMTLGPWRDDEDWEDARDRVMDWVDQQNAGKPKPWSVFAEPLMEVAVEEHPAEAFPTETPYYH